MAKEDEPFKKLTRESLKARLRFVITKRSIKERLKRDVLISNLKEERQKLRKEIALMIR